MVSEARRAAIRKRYRFLRLNADRTQFDVEVLARLDSGRYWKIENGQTFPTDEERIRIARVLKVGAADLPSDERAAVTKPAADEAHGAAS